MTLDFARCPVCRTVNIVHPGTPPSQLATNFHNRCTARRLSGHYGHTNRSSDGANLLTGGWNYPPRGTAYCGAPLVDFQGQVVPPLPAREFIRLTSDEFAPNDIILAVYVNPRLIAIAQGKIPAHTIS